MTAGYVQPYSTSAVVDNTQAIVRVRHLSALTLGALAGVLRLESYAGFALYIAGVLATTGLLSVFVGLSPSQYFSKPAVSLTFTGVFPATMGFLLTWVLIYGVVEA